MLPRAVIVMGVSGAGKTTLGEALARCHGRVFIEGDALHMESSVVKMAAGTPLADADRWPWLERVADALRSAQGTGGGVASCSALRLRYRDFLRSRLAGLLFVHPVADLDLLRARLEARKGHYMPTSLLDSQFAALEHPAESEGVVTVPAQWSTEKQLLLIHESLAAHSLTDRPSSQ